MMLPPIAQSPPPAYESQSSKRKKLGGSAFWSHQRPFSGFTALSTLEIVKMANLDCLGEISQCIRASSSSLKSLTVTLDPELVLRAQKPATTSLPHVADDLSDSQFEDELMLDPVSPVAHAPKPTNEADLRQEKSVQEGILARLFDLEDLAPKGKKLEKKLKLSGGHCLKEELEALIGNEFDLVLRSLQDESGSFNAIEKPGNVKKFKFLREMADLYISKHTSQSKRTTKSQGDRPHPAKKPYKPSKLEAPKSSHPAPASSKYDTKWGDVIEEDYPPAMTSPSIVNLGMGGHKSKPPGFPKYHYPGSSSSLNLPTAPSYTGGAESSLGLALPVPYSGATSSSLDPPPPEMHYSNSMSKSSAAKFNSYFEADAMPYFAPHISNSYTKSIAKDYADSHSSGTKTPPTNDDFEASIGPHAGKAPMLSLDAPSTKQYTHGLKSAHDLADNMNNAPKSMGSPISDDSSGSPSRSESPSKVPFFPAETNHVANDGIDIDIDHPDGEEFDSGDDQESISGSDNTEVQMPRKRLKHLEQSRDLQAMTNGYSSSSVPNGHHRPSQLSHVDEMNDYIRTTHGLQLEELRLQYVPLKASIVGKALDLTVLQRITLLETGPQDAFWTLLVKLTSTETPISFKSIHTDNVSFAFLKYLATFGGLVELFMHERRSKNNDTDSEVGVEMKTIRNQALHPHVKTLKRLMLRNERNNTWDVDFGTLHMLAIYAHSLEEMAINLSAATYVRTLSHFLFSLFSEGTLRIC